MRSTLVFCSFGYGRLQIRGPVNKTFPDLCETFTYRDVSTERMNCKCRASVYNLQLYVGKKPKPELPGSIKGA